MGGFHHQLKHPIAWIECILEKMVCPKIPNFVKFCTFKNNIHINGCKCAIHILVSKLKQKQTQNNNDKKQTQNNNNKTQTKNQRILIRGRLGTPSIFCRDWVLEVVWQPQATRMHQIVWIVFKNWITSPILRGQIRHLLSPQVVKFYQSIIWVPPLLKILSLSLLILPVGARGVVGTGAAVVRTPTTTFAVKLNQKGHQRRYSGP